MKIIEKRKCEITIRRPDGKIDKVISPTIDYMVEGVFKQMKKAMADAGRGEPLSYINIEAIIEKEESDYVKNCHRCGKSLDTRQAYSQKEGTYFNNKKVQVITHYCTSCQTILNAVGAGEQTAMEERRA